MDPVLISASRSLFVNTSLVNIIFVTSECVIKVLSNIPAAKFKKKQSVTITALYIQSYQISW